MDRQEGKKNNSRYRHYREALTRTIELFKRYTEGQADEDVRRMLDNWNPEDIPEQYDIPDDVLKAGSEQVTNSVFSQLGFSPEEEDGKQTPQPARRPPVRIFPLNPVAWRKYAAIAVILIASIIGTTYFLSPSLHYNRQDVVQADRTVLFAENDILSATLPDGTQIQINKGSTLSYDKRRFNQKDREVWLEGEAYFDVEKNPSKVFIIHSDKLQTTVRGTSFNISAYKELEKINVSVRTGKVEVSDAGRLLAQLTPNEQLRYNKSDFRAQESNVNWDDAAAWMQGRLLLQNADIDEFLLRIQQLYGVEVTVSNAMLHNKQILISAEKETSFTEVMNAFCFLYEVKYQETAPGKGVLY